MPGVVLKLLTHKLPAASSATALGKPPVVMVTAGAGLPDDASWLAVYMTTVGAPSLANQRSPAASRTEPVGALTPVLEFVTAGATFPLAVTGNVKVLLS